MKPPTIDNVKDLMQFCSEQNCSVRVYAKSGDLRLVFTFHWVRFKEKVVAYEMLLDLWQLNSLDRDDANAIIQRKFIQMMQAIHDTPSA